MKFEILPESNNLIESQTITSSPAYNKNTAPLIEYNGFKFFMQTRGYVLSVINGVKTNNQKYIDEIANFIAPQLKENCILIPAPQHTGKAEYTLSICNKIKELRIDLNIEIDDILSQSPRENMLKDMKKFMSPEELADLDLGMNISDTNMIDKPKYLVDNTISTGKTFDSVKSLIPDIQPLAFSISLEFLRSHK